MFEKRLEFDDTKTLPLDMDDIGLLFFFGDYDYEQLNRQKNKLKVILLN